MKQDEQKQVSKALCDIIDRLKVLADEPINSFSTWPEIQQTIELSHSIFRSVIECFIAPCEDFLRTLKRNKTPFNIWQACITELWTKVDRLRMYHGRIFCNDYLDVIYHHIMIAEMFACLPESLVGSRQFILMPTGTLAVWPLREEFSESVPYWFDKRFVDKFKDLLQGEFVECFECHREKNFERQYVLAHEIFHIIVRQNKNLRDMFADIEKYLPEDLQNVFGDSNTWTFQIEELFCDFAAAWFFGPTYMKAFADEMAYYGVQGSSTHPPGDLRAKFLLISATGQKKHSGYRALKSYLELRDQSDNSPSEKSLITLKNAFEGCLDNLKLKRFKLARISKKVLLSFKKNIPFVVDDIRIFMNNLPPDNKVASISHYTELMSESLRKTNLLRQVKEYVSSPEELFAAPGALGID